MPRKRSMPVDLTEEIARLAVEGYSPAQIHSHLEGQDRFKRRLPSLRTVQRVVKELAPPDTSEEWCLADAEPADARLVLDVLAEITARAERRIRLSRATAEWAAKVGRAAPTLPLYDVWRLAVEYRRRAERRESTGDLDVFLAFRPWEGEEAAGRYESVLNAGIAVQPLYIGKWWRDIGTRFAKGEEDARPR